MNYKKLCILVLAILAVCLLARFTAQARVYEVKRLGCAKDLDYNSTSSVRAFVLCSAEENGVSTSTADWIVNHESQYRPWVVGDDHLICRRTGKKQRSRGLWQISDCFHGEVSDDVAFDPVLSTNWALGNILKGGVNEWSTWRFRRLWFKDK